MGKLVERPECPVTLNLWVLAVAGGGGVTAQQGWWWCHSPAGVHSTINLWLSVSRVLQ